MSRRRAPVRTCIGCRENGLKAELLRFVARSGGRVVLDRRAVEPGRGAYLHRDEACVDRALVRHAFERAFRTSLGSDEVSRLREDVKRELDTA